jgi:hypothetical protein
MINMEFDSTKEGKWRVHEIFEIIVYLVLGIMTLIVIPLFFGFAGGGFNESFVTGKALSFGDILVNLLIYYIMAIPSLGIIIFEVGKIFYLRKGESIVEKKDGRWYGIFSYSILHNPEQEGALFLLFDRTKIFNNFNPMNWSINFFRVFIISFLLFIPISLFQAETGNSVVGIPQQSIMQQLSPSGNVFFQTFIPAFAETFLILFLFFLIMGFIGWLISKTKLENNIKLIAFFFIAILIVSPIIGFSWMKLHSVVYGNSDIKSTNTFIFGTTGTAITVITGTSIPFYVWHITNNLFLAIVTYSTIKEDVIFISLSIWAILLFIYIAIEILSYRWRKKHKKKLEDFDY